MISSPENTYHNESLLNNDEGPCEDRVYDFISAIAVNRPYKSLTEVQAASDHLNQVMYTLEQTSANLGNALEDYDTHICGTGEILRACRLISLRIEQYLDTKIEGEQK